jgi:putative transposase
MTDYRRIFIPGSTWFFTVNLAERRDNHLLVEPEQTQRTRFVSTPILGAFAMRPRRF